MNKIVIAVDSFKDCLPASQVAETVAHAIRENFPECKIVTLPVSDGGEGLTEILVDSLHGLYHTVDAVDPWMRPIKCKIGSVNKCAIIETAQAIGLELLKPEERNPLKTTSYGLGMLINAAYDLGYRKMLIGMGGTATVDCGLGALQAMGIRFFNGVGKVLPNGITGESMLDIEYYDMINTKRKFKDVQFSIACDVNNPIAGPRGAAFVFGPQKGAKPDDVQKLDFNLRHICHILRHNNFSNFENVQGGGSAGGLGLAFYTFMGCKLSSGIDCVLDLINFNNEVEDADLVITGEGRVDAQSLMGKALTGIARRVLSVKKGLLVIGGRVADIEILNRSGIKNPLEVTPQGMSDEEALRPDVAMQNIYDAVYKWAKAKADAMQQA